MSRAVSTAKRYRSDNGPVVFGTPKFDVRWNRETKTIVIEACGTDAAWSETGEVAELLLLTLAASHKNGRMDMTLRDIMIRARDRICDEVHGFYRVGPYMCWKPSWQTA